MKKLLIRFSIYILAVMFGIGATVINAEMAEAKTRTSHIKSSKKGGTGKKTAAKKKTGVSSSPSSKSVGDRPVAPTEVATKENKKSKNASRQFEGQLMYNIYHFSNKAARVLTFGALQNGPSTMFLTIKGDEIEIYDATNHTHQILKPKDKKAIHYSDITREGIIISGDLYDEIYDQQNKERRVGDKVYRINKQQTVHDQRVNFKGDDCTVVDELLTQSEDGQSPMMEMRSQLWTVPQLKVSDLLTTSFQGFGTGEVAKKGLINTQIRVPVVGALKMQQAFELMGINERKISSGEMNPPADIILVTAYNTADLGRYNSKHEKALKKSGRKPKGQKAREIKEKISDEWAFAEDWRSYTLTPPENELTAWQFAESIASGLAKNTSNNIWESDGTTSDNVSERQLDSMEAESDAMEEEELRKSQTEEERERIKKKNLELVVSDHQKVYDNAARRKQNIYDNYAKFHESNIKELMKDYVKDGKFSSISVGDSQYFYRDCIKRMRQEHNLMMATYKRMKKRGVELKKHPAHDLKFDYTVPTVEAESRLRAKGLW